VANLVSSAVRIDLTFQFLTFNLWISRKSCWSIAQGFVIDNITVAVDTTIARIHTKGVVTSLVQGTLIIRLTTNRHWYRWQFALNLWISQVACWTGTLWSMKDNLAECIWSARI
jgi:hypothetical protein